MKILSTIILVLISTIYFSQDLELEKNSNWKKYKKVIETNFENNSKTEFFLEDGKIKNIKIFTNNLLIKKIFFNENEMNAKDSTKNIYNDGEFNYFYNEKKQLTEKRSFETLFLTQYFYDKNGLLKKTIGTDVKNRYRHIIEYSYDKCSNITEEKEEEIGESIRGYLFKPSVLNYEYKYNNKDCIWTKKHLTIYGKKKLVKKRFLKKIFDKSGNCCITRNLKKSIKITD